MSNGRIRLYICIYIYVSMCRNAYIIAHLNFGIYFDFHFSSLEYPSFKHQLSAECTKRWTSSERFAASNVFLNTLVNMEACYPIRGLMGMIETPSLRYSIFHALSQMKCMLSINFLRRYIAIQSSRCDGVAHRALDALLQHEHGPNPMLRAIIREFFTQWHTKLRD